MRTARILALLAPALLTPLAAAQAFNLDLGGSPATKPASTYGAAAGQSGFWDTSYDGILRDISGNQTAAELGTTGGVDNHDIPGSSGDDERLMESHLSFTPNFNTLSMTGIAPGPYRLYIYCWLGSVLGSQEVHFKVSNGVTNHNVTVSFDSVWPGGHVEGETYAVVPVDVTPEFGFIGCRMGFNSGFNVVNGLQLVPVPAPGAAAVMLGLPLIAFRSRRN